MLVAAPPYDVVNTEEARRLAEGKPLSFLRVSRSELEFPPGTDPHSDAIYERAAQNLGRLMSDGVLVQDDEPCLYAYRQTWRGHAQTGLVVAANVDDYLNDVIKKHEHTRKDKEDDRTRHVDTTDANSGPVFLTYRHRPEVDALMARATAGAPVYDFDGPNEVHHTFWVIEDEELVDALVAAFAAIPELYVADGHHRSASAARVGRLRRERTRGWTGEESFNWFLAVLFPDEQLRILDYNRVVADLNGLAPEAFLERLRAAGAVVDEHGAAPYAPEAPRRFGMYLGGRWYRLAIDPAPEEAADPVRGLDVSLLQDRVLAPILGIQDPRTDQRIDFVGGIRGLTELVRRVDQGGAAVAFALHPTTIAQLMAIADAGRVMPPKSTWFEPKLLSGLVVHKLS
jgi:uncharacterized protein (DUF1015 family)